MVKNFRIFGQIIFSNLLSFFDIDNSILEMRIQYDFRVIQKLIIKIMGILSLYTQKCTIRVKTQKLTKIILQIFHFLYPLLLCTHEASFQSTEARTPCFRSNSENYCEDGRRRYSHLRSFILLFFE